jgi:glutamate-1-semialdehyde 2,1-aminomutase
LDSIGVPYRMKPSTNSKEHFPIITKAKGKCVCGIDGNKYIDFTGSNLTVIHGYRPITPCVPNLPGVSKTEKELSWLLSEYTNTKQFRYYKNGSDAVNNAIRLARHIHGGNCWGGSEVTFIGYAGSNDSYVQTINDNGIPYHEVTCNYQIKDFNKLPKETEILVYEKRYSYLAAKINARIKICDYLKEGIIGLYMRKDNDDNVNADFCCYGKSIANGSAIAVLTGKDKYMERIDEVYYSTTFGCNQDAMIEAIRTIKDFEKVKDRYFKLYKYAKEVLPPWFSATPEQIKKFQKQGILYNGYYQIMTCHNKKDIDILKKACNKIL